MLVNGWFIHGANPLEHLARIHVEKLNLDFSVNLFLAGNEIAQHVLPVRSVDEKGMLICGSSTTGR